MGWKTIKDHYGIKHTVQVCHVDGKGDCICIGSPFISDLITISLDGCVLARSVSLPPVLEDVYARMVTDRKTGLLQSLVSKRDTFVAWWPVYSPENGMVVEDFCEQYGYPNITHSGDLMFDNKHFKTVKEARQALMAETRVSCSFLCSHFKIIWAYMKDIGRQFGYIFNRLWLCVKARTVGRFLVRGVKID